MATIAVLLYEGCYASSLTGVIDSLQVANAHIKRVSPNSVPFSWLTVSQQGKTVTTHGGIRLQADVSLEAMPTVDMIFIPACFYPGAKPFAQWLSEQQVVRNWLISQWQAGVTVSANGTGTV